MDQSNAILQINDVTTFSESFQEQLYVTNVLKEFFHLQLLEQQEQQTGIDHQLCPQVDEIHVHTQSDVLERNKSLETELYQCRSKLEATIKENAELQNLLHNVKEENDHRVASLEREFADLNMNIRLVTEERDKMKEQEEFLNEEIKRLSAELVIFQDEKSVHNQQHEQLIEDTIILQSNLEIYKSTLTEVAGLIVNASSQVDTRSEHHDSTVDIDRSVRIPIMDQTDTAVAGMKGQLEEAQNLLQSLEKAIDEMQAPKARISKLVQAFESKSLDDGDGSEEAPSSVSSYTSSKAQCGQLRTLLETLTQNHEHFNTLVMKEKAMYNGAVAARVELESEIETLKGFNYELELRNIELEVLWEAMNQYLHNIEAKKAQLFDALQGKEVQLNELRRTVGELTSVFSDEIKTLQSEMKKGIHTVERQWNSSLSELVVMVEKLDAIIASSGNYSHHVENTRNLDVFDRFSLSLTCACEVIEQLKTRLEVGSKDYETLSDSYMEVESKIHSLNDEHNLAIVLLHKLSDVLVRFHHVSGNDFGNDHIQIKESEPLEPLDPSYYEALLEKSDCLIDDFRLLKESNNKLYSDLVNRTNEIQELNNKTVDEDVLLKIIMDIKDAMKLQDNAFDLDEVSVVHLQSFVLLLIERYKEIDEQANKLSNDFNSELQGHVEVLVLRESLTQAKDALDATYVELLGKAKELEQSEQRVASIREKLSIAVAKGKGLVVQRDSLKHSISEMSSELEKRSQELQVKESKLLEVEERLKAYSEAGERMEALESELSYIRNSATALRESFLMKDNTLMRIEEILEDLDLPEQFHTKDITEKIDWLAKTVVGNSLPSVEWDPRSSEDDTQSASHPADELKRKCDELQTKLYEMAEQNEMLEQSLMDRNILVQRWEEILDRIHTPPQIRSMEPVERVHWLGTAVSEADNHMRSLETKVESLENYCRSLSEDLEESQEVISKQESAFYTVLIEKESALTEAEDSLKSLREKHADLENHCESLSTDLEESRRKVTELESLLRDDVDSLKSLKQKYAELENYCESLSTELAESRRKVTELESLLRDAVRDKETFANEVNSLKSLGEKHADLENNCESLSAELAGSQRRVTELESLLRDAIRDKETFATDVDSLKSLREKHADLESYCESLSAELEGSRRKVTELESLLQDAIHDKETFANDVDSLKSLKEKYVNLENHCESLSTDLEESRRKVTDLESLLQDAIRDKETFVNDVESLKSLKEKHVNLENNCESLSAELAGSQRKVIELECLLRDAIRDKDIFANDVASLKSLKEKHVDLENNCESLSTELAESRRKVTELESLLRDAIRDKETFANDVDSLKSVNEKHDYLESYCESLSTELAESRRKVTELESLLRDAIRDKEAFANDVDSLKSLREKHVDLQSHCESLSTDLEESRRKVTELESLLQDAIRDKENFANDVVSLTSDRDRVLGTVAQYEQEVDRLVKEADLLQKQKHETEGHIQLIENEMKRLQRLILSVLQTSGMDNALSDENNVQNLEMLIMRLIDEHTSRPVSELSSSLDEIKNLKEERDAYMENNQTLANEIESLKTKVTEVEGLLKQEEQKSTSLREKLNLAVRKGKSLVQQRDSMKQSIEEMTTEIDQFKSKINHQEHALSESAQTIHDLSNLLEQYKAFETENLSLKNDLMKTDETDCTLNMVLSKLSEIDLGDEIGVHDPLQKLERVRKLCSDLRAEASKSRKAAELLLAELNEVQERNDSLQDEIARAYDEISSISKERDLAESAKGEALSHMAELSEDRKKQLAEFEKLNYNVHEVKKGFFEISGLVGDVFAKNKEVMRNVRSHVKSCLEHFGVEVTGAKDSDGLVSVNSRFKDFWSRNLLWDDKLLNHSGENVGLDNFMDVGLHFQQLSEEIGGIKDTINNYSISLDKETEVLNTMISTMLKSIISQKDSFDSMKGLCSSLESTVKEKDIEASVFRRTIHLLYDACLGSLTEIETRKSQLVGQTLTARDLKVNFPSLPSVDGAAEDCVKTLAEELSSAVKDYVDIVTENVEGHSNEMRSTILNLQKELQEKDMQRERICMELASQVKEAETKGLSYARELQSMESYAQELESKLEALEKKRALLEQQVEELRQGHSSIVEWDEKVKSLNGAVAAKDQEIESLMQALDEEENEMETLRNRVNELEKLVEKKTTDLERVENSRAKTAKKLTVTVSKFDELHRLSEHLLSEVENLQSQLQDRDTQISFLRKEVTRCTNDALEATKKAKDRSSGELLEFLKWLDSVLSDANMCDTHARSDGCVDGHELKENIQKDIVGLVSALGELQTEVQKGEGLLLEEKSKVEVLSHRKEELEKELRGKSVRGSRDSELESSEIVEVEPVLNKWSVPVNTSGSQVRSLRKANNDQVSIAIDSSPDNSGSLEDDDDDKVHGFKSLTTSRFVPKFTRPISDMIDGLWVSCDRALMRQPAFRLGIMIYWAVLHALLASLVV